jgi:hypothetical protein
MSFVLEPTQSFFSFSLLIRGSTRRKKRATFLLYLRPLTGVVNKSFLLSLHKTFIALITQRGSDEE